MTRAAVKATALIGVAAVVALFFFAGAGGQSAEQDRLVLEDLAFGKTIGGSLHSASGQFVCFDSADAMRGAYRTDDTPAADEIREQLIKSWRCMSTPPGAAFSMTADGRERFVTAHGTVELWSG